MNRSKIGSMTAKGGFINEHAICEKFLNFKNDNEAQTWLKIMGYNFVNIQKLVAVQIPARINLKRMIELGVTQEKYDETIKFKKADIQVRVEIVVDNILHVENISLKKSNKTAGFNQVDKRAVSTYKNMWNFEDKLEHLLKLFTGEILPKSILSQQELQNIKDSRRLFLTEMSKENIEFIKEFFTNNKTLIISDILRGRGGLSAEWFLVTRKDIKNDGFVDWLLKDINTVCNFYSQGEVKITPRGSLKIGRVTMQRKGGTPDPTSLQFKINPLELFNA